MHNGSSSLLIPVIVLYLKRPNIIMCLMFSKRILIIKSLPPKRLYENMTSMKW